MSRVVSFLLRDGDYALAVAHARDRSLRVSQIARAALMSDVKRAAKREHLIDELVRQLRPLLVSDAQSHGRGGAAAAQGGI